MNAILKLAAKLPSGLVDPKSKAKLEHEYQELCESLREKDAVGALLEAADCYYYANKAMHNGLIERSEYSEWMKTLTYETGHAATTIRQAAIAKYKLRARTGNPKADAEERKAVERLTRKE